MISWGGHSITFFSKQFCPKLLHSSTYVRELVAITTTVKKWCQYLLGHHFIIIMDHHSLKELMAQVIQTPEQHLYLLRLLGYDYMIQYKTCKSNMVANALSRSSDNLTGSLFLLFMSNLLFLTELKQELSSNGDFVNLHNAIQADPTTYYDYSLT